jgi:hypothetical protein
MNDGNFDFQFAICDLARACPGQGPDPFKNTQSELFRSQLQLSFIHARATFEGVSSNRKSKIKNQK